jgi:hypothetical protein
LLLFNLSRASVFHISRERPCRTLKTGFQNFYKGKINAANPPPAPDFVEPVERVVKEKNPARLQDFLKYLSRYLLS